jgi:hypothetical protein
MLRRKKKNEWAAKPTFVGMDFGKNIKNKNNWPCSLKDLLVP